MISLKGILLGIGLALVGTIIYLGLVVHSIVQRSHSTPQGTVGIDVISLWRSLFHSPLYWLFVLGLLATGCAIVSLWPRPSV
jgi:uncharacterized membrane protein